MFELFYLRILFSVFIIQNYIKLHSTIMTLLTSKYDFSHVLMKYYRTGKTRC